jgi:hypothetical protein
MALTASAAVAPACSGLASLLGQQLFPSDYPWNQNIAIAPVAANSAAIIAHIGNSTRVTPNWGADNPANGSSPLYGIPFNIVHGNSTTNVNVIIDNYPGESDVVPAPIPTNAVIQGDFQNGPNPNGGGYNANQRGDSHLIVWDEDNNVGYEFFGASRPSDPTLYPNASNVELPHTDGKWHAAQETVWHFNTEYFRTLGESSADSAGLSILAGLARPDEGLTVAQGGQGAINHALRVTLPSGDINPHYIYPGAHMVGTSPGADNLPFGGRLRLKNTPAVNTLISNMPPESQILARAMQQYGLVVADFGGAMYVSGASGSVNATNGISLVWDLTDIQAANGIEALSASNFDVVTLAPIVSGLSAGSGPTGSALTISGQNFSGAAGHISVFFGSTPANSVSVLGDSLISCTVPSGSGPVDVTVQSGTNEVDSISSNPNANVNAPIFGYGTSALTSADKFTNTTPPPNDPCAGAIALTNGVPYIMNTEEATSTGDPLVPCGPLQNGVWFTYTPTNQEQVTVSTCGSDFDTMLEVFAGTCGALHPVPYGCDDDNGPTCTGTRASVVLEGSPGVTYYILAGGFSGLTGNLSIVATSALVNDGCAGAFPLHYGVPFSMSTANATSSTDPTPGCAFNNLFGNGVWFTFTSPVTGPVPISTCGSTFDTVLDVYTGSCGALTSVACDDDNGPSCNSTRASVSLNATSGVTYLILAGGFNSGVGELDIMAGVPPTIAVGVTNATLSLSWSNYYFPWYELQRETGPLQTGPWQNLLPNIYVGSAVFTNIWTNPPTFYRLVTP